VKLPVAASTTGILQPERFGKVSDGKQVTIKVSKENGKIKCEIVTAENRDTV